MSPYRRAPSSPATLSCQGVSETRRMRSPPSNRPRAGRLSPREENSRAVPAFQYSDSEDSSTKPSSASSYANSEENSEPYGHHRRMGNSCNSLNESQRRGPSPLLIISRSTGQSSESLNSYQKVRSFSFNARPVNSKLSGVRYLNTSDLGIVSTSGAAGSYSVNHNSKIPPGLSRRGYISTSLSTISKANTKSDSNLRTAKSQVHMYTPYLTNPGYYRTNRLSGPSIFEEDLLEWRAADETEVTLV